MSSSIDQQVVSFLPSIFDKMHESVVLTDADLEAPGPRILYANPAFEHMTGYRVEEMLGSSPRLLQGPQTDRDVIGRLRRQLKAGEAFEGETMNYRKDGTAFVMQWYIEPLHSEAGEITHFVAIQRDVTKEREKHRQQRALEQAVSQLVDFAVLFQADGSVSYANRSYIRWCRKNPVDVIGASVWSLPGAPRNTDLKWARRVLGQGAAWRQEYSVRHGEGDRRLLVTISPVEDESGSREFLAVGRDISEPLSAGA